MKKISIILRKMLHHQAPLRFLLGQIILRCPFDITAFFHHNIKIEDFLVRLRPSSLAVSFWLNSHQRKLDYEFITTYLHQGETYIDIGANIGTTVIPAAISVGSQGRVIAFEPNSRVFMYLEENVRINSLNNVELYNFALGEKNGSVRFSNRIDDDQNRILMSGKGMTVPMRRLDDMDLHIKRINLLKIDVEGYEQLVFAGANNSLYKTDCIYFEITNNRFYQNCSTQELIQILVKMGFRIFAFTKSRHVTEIISNYAISDHTENAFAIRNVESFSQRTGWRIDIH